jgi:hypothetical protein
VPNTRRPWSEDDIAELKSLAGALPVLEIAAKLRRSPGAVTVEACKLGLSLRTRPRHFARSGPNDIDVSTQHQNPGSAHSGSPVPASNELGSRRFNSGPSINRNPGSN